MAEYQSPHGPLRQSLLRQANRCPLSAKWAAENGDWSTPEQALGTALHLVAEEILRTLQRTGQREIPTQEAVEIMYEQVARPDCPHVSDEQMRDLLIMVLQLASHQWAASRIVAIERRQFADVPCPDGRTRTVTGSPDVLIADPPGGGIVVDFKSGWARPKAPRDGDWDREAGRPYLSERGVFQLDTYGLLVMANYPAVERVVLREYHLRWGETREAVLTRPELEHVERRLGVLLQRLEGTLTGELEAEARPGSWCRPTCPKIAECPIPREQRGEGAIGGADHATLVAGRFVVEDGQRTRDRAALKAYCEATGEAVWAGDSFVGFLDDGRFGLWAAEKATA